MAFPLTALPVVVEIAPGATPTGDPGDWEWTDVTNSVRMASGITIDEGRGDWGDYVDPGRCALTFDNLSGDFSQHNPRGQWYGQLGRNTPLRVRLRRGEDAFGRTASSGWGTSDSGQAWSNSGGSSTDYSVSSGAGWHSHGSTNVLRRTTLAASLVDVEQVFDVSTPALITGAALVTGALFRYIDFNNYYWARCEFNSGGTSVRLKLTKKVAGVETLLADLNPVPALSYAAGTPLRVRARVDGQELAVKVWTASGSEPAGWQLTATDTDLTSPGAVGVQSWLVSGNSNTLPLVVSFDNYAALVDLHGGWVPAWVPRWDLSGNNRVVPVTSYGAQHRLTTGEGSAPVLSPLHRRIAAEDNVLAYWPLEDEGDATQAASGLLGGDPMAILGYPTFGASTVEYSNGGAYRYGTRPLPDFTDGGGLIGSVPRGTSSPIGWSVQMFFQSTTGDDDNVVLLRWTTPGGTYVRWDFVQDPAAADAIALYAYTAAGSQTTVFSIATNLRGPADAVFAGVQSGGNIRVYLRFGLTTWGPYDIAGTNAYISTVAINPDQFDLSAGQNLLIGHLRVYDHANATPLSITTLRADWGEGALARLARLAAEDGVTLEIGTAATDILMGSQPDGTALELYRQSQAVDNGVLFERPYKLSYRTRDDLYNQPPTLTMATSDLGAPPEPDGTDQRYRNRWTVRRPGGSQAHAIADDVTAGGLVYDDSADTIVAYDSQLADQATWRLHLTSTDDLRWPQLALNLAARPELIDQWLCCRIGSRITVTDPPDDVGDQDIDVLLQGHSTTLGYKTWSVSTLCSPASEWTVGVYDTSRYQDTASELASSFVSGTGTSMSVAVTSGPLWTTAAADFPLVVEVGGAQLTVTAISGSSSPQTFTVSTTVVNGVSKTIPTGTAVRLADPTIYAL
jgi:hypothetical protein